MRLNFSGGKSEIINFYFLILKQSHYFACDKTVTLILNNFRFPWSLNLHDCQVLRLIFIFVLNQAGAPFARPLVWKLILENWKLSTTLLPKAKSDAIKI